MSDQQTMRALSRLAELSRIADLLERIAKALEDQSQGATAFAELMSVEMKQGDVEERLPWETPTQQ